MTLSCWLDSPYKPRSPLSADVTADAAVIGAGMTGVGLALNLLRAGLKVALVDAGCVAAGASGRNAGFVTSGLGEHYSRSVAFWGPEDARAILKLHLRNQEILRALLEIHKLDCGYRRTGSVAAAEEAGEEAVLRESHELLVRDGFASEIMQAPEVNRLLSGDGFLCGLFNPADALIDPVRLVRGLAGAAERRGSAVFENSPVIGLERQSGAWLVKSHYGSVSAGLVFLACNALLPLLVPGVAVEPVRGQCLAIKADLPPTPCLTNYGAEYWRGSEKGAIFGGMRRFDADASSCRDEVTESVQAEILKFCRRHFPRLSEARVTYRWSGTMAYTADGLPVVGPVPGSEGMFVAAGYTGHGFGWAFLAGQWLADLAAAGRDEIHRLCRIDRKMRPSPALSEA